MAITRKIVIELAIIAISLPVLGAALIALAAMGYVLYKIAYYA